MFCNLLFVAMQVGWQPGSSCPVDERLRHTAMDWVCLQSIITILKQSIQELAGVIGRDVKPTQARMWSRKHQYPGGDEWLD